MKKYLKIMASWLYSIAVVSSATPSQLGAYQPESPKKLQKKSK